MAETESWFTKIGAAGRLHPFQHTPHGNMIDIESEDFVFAVTQLQLQGTQYLAQLAGWGAGMWLQKPDHLHGQGGSTGNNAAIGEPLPRCPAQSQGIHPRMPVKKTIFVGEQRLEIAG